MLKKIIIALLVVFPLTAMAQKFGVVDYEEVAKAMPEYTQMQTQIAEASKKYEDEVGKLTEEINKKLAELQQMDQDPNTLQSIKERRIQELNELDAKRQQFLNSAQQDLQRMQVQLMAPIETKFMDAIKAVGQEGGYVFIFPKGVSLYDGAGVEDVTTAVKAKLGVN